MTTSSNNAPETDTKKKNILFILRATPYASSLAQDGIEAVLAAAIFNQTIKVIFIEQGIFQLHQQKSNPLLAGKNIAALLESFPLYDITQIFIEQAAVARFNLSQDSLILPTTALTPHEINTLISDADTILRY